MANGSYTATTSTTEDPLSSSQLLSGSLSSSSSSRQGQSQISKTYKQASSLFLTRRLPEALSTIEPLIRPPTHSDETNGVNGAGEFAPVATASRSTRIKVWSLYLAILNAAVELGPQDGKNVFGSQEWRRLVSKARDGTVWEDIVQDGYGGVEGEVDADVVINLATLLLTHAPSQTLNQERLESYLSASSQPNLDLDAHLQPRFHSPTRRRPSPSNGTDTPRDLTARIKILELYTLHVLPRNGEWDYSREFISISEILDDERKEAFVHTLQQLKEEKARDDDREEELKREQQEQLETQRETNSLPGGNASATQKPDESTKERFTHKRATSEVDYGIEASIGSHNHSSKNVGNQSKTSHTGKTQLSPPPRSPRPSAKPAKKSRAPPGLYGRAALILAALQKVVKNMAQTIGSNPLVLLRTVLFLFTVILAFSRRDIRERIRRLTEQGWDKLKGTVGMGVKVTYI